MSNFKHETIILTKEAYRFAKDFERAEHGRKPLSETFFQHIWTQGFRNGGANPATHPIGENEIRVDRDSFGFSLARVKSALAANGFEWREDGFIQEGFYI